MLFLEKFTKKSLILIEENNLSENLKFSKFSNFQILKKEKSKNER